MSRVPYAGPSHADWVGRDVLIELGDRRWQTKGVWIDAGDVRRH